MIEPKKIVQNWPANDNDDVSCSVSSAIIDVSYNIIEIASFKILSPKIKIYKILSTPISLKIPNTATVSVADIKDPKAKHILNVNCGANPIYATI